VSLLVIARKDFLSSPSLYFRGSPSFITPPPSLPFIFPHTPAQLLPFPQLHNIYLRSQTSSSRYLLLHIPEATVPAPAFLLFILYSISFEPLNLLLYLSRKQEREEGKGDCLQLFIQGHIARVPGIIFPCTTPLTIWQPLRYASVLNWTCYIPQLGFPSLPTLGKPQGICYHLV